MHIAKSWRRFHFAVTIRRGVFYVFMFLWWRGLAVHFTEHRRGIEVI